MPSRRPPTGARGLIQPILPAARMAKMIDLGELRELSRETVQELHSIAMDPRYDVKPRVAAGRCVVAHHQWREDYERPLRLRPEDVVQALGGAAAVTAFLVTNFEAVRELLQAQGHGELEAKLLASGDRAREAHTAGDVVNNKGT